MLMLKRPLGVTNLELRTYPILGWFGPLLLNQPQVKGGCTVPFSIELEILSLLKEIENAMRSLGPVLGADFNDFDVEISQVSDEPRVVGFVVQVHRRGYEYGAYLALDKARSLEPALSAAYLYGYGAGRHYQERIDPELNRLMDEESEKSDVEFQRLWEQK